MFWEALSTIVSVAGQVQQANAQVRAAMFNQNISRYNAGVTRVSGQIEEDRVRREGRRRIGQIIANVGASGFDMSGSSEDLLYESTYNAQMDAQITRFNYASKATGYDMEGNLFGAQASDARRSGYLNAASSLLRGATDYYGHNADYGAGSTPFRLGGGSSNTTTTSNGQTITWDN